MASGKICSYWCITDFAPTFVLVNIGLTRNDGTAANSGHCRIPDDVYIVPAANFDAAYALWEKYHDRLQFGLSPFAQVNTALRELNAQRRRMLHREVGCIGG